MDSLFRANYPFKIYLLIIVLLAFLIILLALFNFLQVLVNKQVDEQIEAFFNQAKIPRVLRKKISIRIKWF